MSTQVLRQAIVCKGHNVSAKRIADQSYVIRMPFLQVGLHHVGKVIRRLAWSFLAPEISQAVPSNDRHALLLQVLRDGLVQITPSAIAGNNYRHQVRRMPDSKYGQGQFGYVTEMLV